VGDILGCFIDLEKKSMHFSLNGEELGNAFSNVSVGGGMFPALSISAEQQCRFNFGGSSFKFPSKPELGFLPYAMVSGDKSLVAETNMQNQTPATIIAHSISTTAAPELKKEFVKQQLEILDLQKRLKHSRWMNFGLSVGLLASLGYSIFVRLTRK